MRYFFESKNFSASAEFNVRWGFRRFKSRIQSSIQLPIRNLFRNLTRRFDRFFVHFPGFTFFIPVPIAQLQFSG